MFPVFLVCLFQLHFYYVYFPFFQSRLVIEGTQILDVKYMLYDINIVYGMVETASIKKGNGDCSVLVLNKSDELLSQLRGA